ncbi:MAG: hypothetical protein R3308_00175 [Thiohalobacterales bacterium]|nr:hypothetical protein [Thiohalobacterales bacterium]
MNSLLSTSITVVITVVVTTVLISHQVNNRIDRETSLREQLDTRLLYLNQDIASLNERLDQLVHTRVNMAIDGNIRMNAAPGDDVDRLDDHDETLRALVRSLIEEERASRLAATKESQWKRLRQWQEDRDGPYGKHNVRINALTRSLNLDYTQASYYHTLLTQYEEQANSLYAGIGDRTAAEGSDPGLLQALLNEADAEKRVLDESLDQAFVQTLTPEQANRYWRLPEEERGVGPNAGLSQVRFDLSVLRKLASAED